jgi:hypothetical protein
MDQIFPFSHSCGSCSSAVRISNPPGSSNIVDGCASPLTWIELGVPLHSMVPLSRLDNMYLEACRSRRNNLSPPSLS